MRAEIGTKAARLQADLFRNRVYSVVTLVEDLLRVADEVHLVDGDDDLLDAEQAAADNRGAGYCSRTPSLAAISSTAASALAAPVIMFLRNSLWPGRIDDHVRALRRLELDLRGIDRDVLLLLLEQRIEQEGILELHPLLATGRLDLLDLAVGQRVRCRKKCGR